MKAKYKYNELEYLTEEEILKAHDNIHCIKHEPILEKYIIKEEKPDPEDEEKTVIIDVKRERKIGNTFIYIDMTDEHINKIRQLEINKQLNDINTWYKERDYYQGKILRKEWEETDPRWTEYLEGCKDKQAERDVLLVELETL